MKQERSKKVKQQEATHIATASDRHIQRHIHVCLHLHCHIALLSGHVELINVSITPRGAGVYEFKVRCDNTLVDTCGIAQSCTIGAYVDVLRLLLLFMLCCPVPK